MSRKNPVPLLRIVALIEGVSFLVLLLIAMPLKHFGGMPMAVKVFGWIHGVLFMAFVLAWIWTVVVARWPVGRSIAILAAALLPAGPFVVDGRMRRYAAEFA